MQAFLRSGLSLYRSRSIRLRRSISHPSEQVDLTFISGGITPLHSLHFAPLWRFFSRFLSLRARLFRAVLHSLEHSSASRSEEHTSELQSRFDLVCRLLLEKKKKERMLAQNWRQYKCVD